MSLPDITLCMIVRNEESNLERCLQSVQGLVSEIIIGDTGSDDRSVEIAQFYDARVINVPWEGDFAKARNTVLEQATSSWILSLDADEELVNGDAAHLIQLTMHTGVTGYYLTIQNLLVDSVDGEYISDCVCRLFRCDPNIRYRGNIHEEVTRTISEIPGSLLVQSDLVIKHKGYQLNIMQNKHKNDRNLTLIQEALETDPDNPQLLYALGTEYYQLEQYASAADTLLPLLDQLAPTAGYLSDIYLKASYSLYCCGAFGHAEITLLRGLGFYSDFTDLRELLALLYISQKRWSEAQKELQYALQSGPCVQRYSSYSGSGSYYTCFLLGKVAEVLLRYEDALSYYEKALHIKPSYKPAWIELSTLLLWQDSNSHLDDLTNEYIELFEPDLLTALLPAALNSSNRAWINLLCSSPALDPLNRELAEFIGEVQIHCNPASLINRLTTLHNHHPEHEMIIFYLWALSLTYEEEPLAHKWLHQLKNTYPELLAIQALYTREGQHHDDDNTHVHYEFITSKDQLFNSSTAAVLHQKGFLHALQVLIQIHAWENVLRLYQAAHLHLCWSNLPQSLLIGLLQAPAEFLMAWCDLYENLILPRHEVTTALSSSDLMDWVLYAIVANTCLKHPRSSPQIRQTLQHSKQLPAARLLHVYLLLDQANNSFTKVSTAPRTNWSILLRSFIAAR